MKYAELKSLVSDWSEMEEESLQSFHAEADTEMDAVPSGYEMEWKRFLLMEVPQNLWVRATQYMLALTIRYYPALKQAMLTA